MKYNFGMAVDVEKSTGEVLAVYFQIRKGKVAETKEARKGIVFADYDKSGNLLGIEQLGPCPFSVLEKLTRNDPTSRQFIRRTVPQEMAVA